MYGQIPGCQKKRLRHQQALPSLCGALRRLVPKTPSSSGTVGIYGEPRT